MLDIGWQELFLIAVFAILVVGPKDLPRMMKMVMMWVRKARGLAREFQSGVDEMVREADLDDLKKDIGSISKPGDLTRTITDAVDPTGELGNIQKDMDKTARYAMKEDPIADPLKTPESAGPENPFKNKSGDELRVLMEKEKADREAEAAKEAEPATVSEEAAADEAEPEPEKKPEQTGESR